MNHGIIISQRHLRRLLSHYGLHRRKGQTDVLTIALFIEQQLQSCGQLYGYRWMHMKCIQQGYVVTQNTVSMLQQLLDPKGVDARRKRRLVRRQYTSSGPNHTWHMDGYDKLKPFGIAISGCIDGFSRKVIWLEAYHTNNNPKIILGYYIRSIIEIGGCPKRIRCDMGTENRYVELVQKFIRKGSADCIAGEKCFIYGTSTANQRIESWWGVLRKHCGQYYMDIFHTLKDDGLFTGDLLDKELIRFCFMGMIQNDMEQLQHSWNSHKMRTDRKTERLGGRPMLLYALPELQGKENQIVAVNMAEVHECETVCVHKEYYPCHRDIFEVSCILMAENTWHVPSTGCEAARLYVNLITQIRIDIGLR